MERYEGITILATDLCANLDDAFTRRLQFVVDFSFSQAAERQRIWRAILATKDPLFGRCGLPSADTAILVERWEHPQHPGLCRKSRGRQRLSGDGGASAAPRAPQDTEDGAVMGESEFRARRG